MRNAAPKIAVLGSINMDIVVCCAHLPRPGETIIADSATEVCGGKGANQAVAAARLGADVTMIGCIGDDSFADHLLENLKREKIDVSHVARRSNCASGLAVVSVDETGENSITVVPGANGTLGVQDAVAAADVIRSSHTLLLQMEVPVETIIAAINIARDSNTRVILDPAPAPKAFPSELLKADLICPNQSEAGVILGREIGSVETARNAATELTQHGAENAIVTLGGQGAVLCDGGSPKWIEPFPIDPVDTTAAGDAFAAAVAVRWAEEKSLLAAAEFACAAGAIAATRAGAQSAMPTGEEIEQLMLNKGKP
ncbi:MAG: ribokinase [Planctomycetaceae bacterium]|nr:ribokinase [Planctomycetaceae bacterium]